MDHLEVPDPLAGLGVDADEAVRKQVVAGAMPAVHVVGRRAGRQVDVAQLEVGAEHRPDVRHPRVLPGVVEPRLDPRLAGPRDRTPGPPEGARPDVVRPDVARMLLLGVGMVVHDAAEDHDVLDHEGRRVAAIAGLRVVGQVDQAAVAEALDQPAGRGIDRHQVRRANREEAAVVAVGPVRDAPVRRAARRLVREELGVLHPEGLARAGVERFDEADAVRGVEHAFYQDGRRAKLVRVAQVGPAGRERGVDGPPPPRDLQVADGLGVDLIERGVARVARVAAVHAPLRAVGSLLRRRRRGAGQGHEQDEGANAVRAGHTDDPAVCHSFVSAIVAIAESWTCRFLELACIIAGWIPGPCARRATTPAAGACCQTAHIVQ